MIQLIASDMDGTLLDADKKLPPQFPALLEELYRRDITLAIASGRSRTALLSLFGDLAEELIFICDNGACVMQPHDAPIFHNLCWIFVTPCRTQSQFCAAFTIFTSRKMQIRPWKTKSAASI